MGTNFYWLIDYKTLTLIPDDVDLDDSKYHIGKRSYAGLGMRKFTWAGYEHKEALEKLVKECVSIKVCDDEYGKEYTAKEMLEEADCNLMEENRSVFC